MKITREKIRPILKVLGWVAFAALLWFLPFGLLGPMGASTTATTLTITGAGEPFIYALSGVEFMQLLGLALIGCYATFAFTTIALSKVIALILKTKPTKIKLEEVLT